MRKPQRPKRRSLSWMRIVGLMIFLGFGACNCNNSQPAASDSQTQREQTAAQAQAPGTAQQEESGGEKIPDELYPGFSFRDFNQKQRAAFVEIMKAELCPCPDATESLHVCLQQPQKRCDAARQVASLAAGMLQANYNQTDILDKMAEFVEARNKKHDFDLANSPHKGPANAPVVVVEFADFQCPHCREASKFLGAVTERFGDDVALYFKHYPLSSHSNSELAARAAVAAHRQGKFWPMHDLLFQHQRELSPRKITQIAQQVGLNMQKFNTDLQNPEVAAIVQRDRGEGDRAGLTGTPTIFINGRLYTGDRSEQALTEALRGEVEATKTDSADAKN